MKICWDNLEKLKYIGNSKWKSISYHVFIYKESCKNCGESFLAEIRDKGLCCSRKCTSKIANINRIYTKERAEKISKALTGKKLTKEHKQKLKENHKGFKGRKHTEEAKKKMSGKNHHMYGKKHTEEAKKKMSESSKGKKINPNTKRGKVGFYASKNIPLYDTFAPQINWIEEVRRNKEDPNILEVKCTWCGKWFIPIIDHVSNRLQILKGNDKYKGEHRFYCSDGCKENCPIYNKTPETLMKEDALRAGRLSWLELNREVQPQLRQMVFKRDNWECQKCGETEGLHCHHIEGIRWNPLESADVDICITVCKEHHKEIHQKDGCGYNDMKCNNI